MRPDISSLNVMSTTHLPENDPEITKEGSVASSVLWIDWDGPKDTLNPKKYVPPDLHFILLDQNHQLDLSQKMDGDRDCVLLHVHLSCVFFYGCSSNLANSR